MKTLPDRQLKCLIIEPSGIIAAELEDELRFAFDAKVYAGPTENFEEVFDIAILDCPTSMTAFLGLIDRLKTKTRAFVFTRTHNLPIDAALSDIVYRNLDKPYLMNSLLDMVSELIDQMDLGNQA